MTAPTMPSRSLGYAGRDFRTFKRMDEVTEASATATGLSWDAVMRLQEIRVIVPTKPAPPAPRSVTPASTESAEHSTVRLATEWLVEHAGLMASRDRGEVRADFEAGADVIPAELRTLYALASKELRRVEKKEATSAK